MSGGTADVKQRYAPGPEIVIHCLPPCRLRRILLSMVCPLRISLERAAGSEQYLGSFDWEEVVESIILVQ